MPSMPMSRCLRPVVLTGLVAAMAMLGGCDTLRSTFGPSKKPPDEFAVLTKAPLVLPPDFTLRPPEPGAPSRVETDPRQKAASTLGASTTSSSAAGTTVAEEDFLKLAGADKVDPNIRQVVNAELSQFIEKDKSFVDTLLFWRKPEPPGTIVNAPAEAQRLRATASAGDPPTTGNTPTIRRRDRALLEGIF